MYDVCVGCASKGHFEDGADEGAYAGWAVYFYSRLFWK